MKVHACDEHSPNAHKFSLASLIESQTALYQLTDINISPIYTENL